MLCQLQLFPITSLAQFRMDWSFILSELRLLSGKMAIK
jgi:hypothetical protein